MSLYRAKSENLANTPQNCLAASSCNHAIFWQAGGYLHESCSFSCKAHNWRTMKLERKAYVRIAEELNSFGVSPYYVDYIWRKYNQDILDTVNRDLVKSLKTLPGSGHPRRISVVELYAKVKAVPFHYHKNVQTLAFKVGIPKSTIHDALKKGLLSTLRIRLGPS